jgi:hypothetical protein
LAVTTVLKYEVDSTLPDKGYANKPDLILNVDGAPEYSKLQPRFYVGRGGDQYNEWQADVLVESLKVHSADFTKKSIWVLRADWVSLPDLGSDMFPIYRFEFYHGNHCLNVRSGGGSGAFSESLPGGNHLGNGWSSRSGVFNTTGIVNVHLKEVILHEQREGGLGSRLAGWNIRITDVRRFVESYTSPDGRRWTLRDSDLRAFGDIAYDIIEQAD